ncbi:uncharacterized protein LOC129568224 [Sitodiplosis mosellana]|uniref:uncharacterized protein LOC129568224 n=1 Tax=Sitodiplosis mosellana TaxID=263140 RepID=UPI002443ABFC|nr:uncharacterized protein LOC129568224 [Sitodiplosis mosellana]
MTIKLDLFVILLVISVVNCQYFNSVGDSLKYIHEWFNKGRNQWYSRLPQNDSKGHCMPGRIESMRFSHNGNMYIKVNSLDGENYTNVERLFKPLMWAFYLDAEIQLITNTCNSSDRGFGSFRILRFNKSIYDVLSTKTKVNIIPMKKLPTS